MPRYIVKLTDGQTNYYMDWSTVVDAPATNGCDLEAFVEGYRREYGGKDLAERMLRVEAKGTSALMYDNADELIAFNRAGPGECPLSKEEIIRFYCKGEEINEKHPCWKARRKALDKVYDEDGGANYEDLERIFKEHPYEDVLPSV